jgi:hypothetical protein
MLIGSMFTIGDVYQRETRTRWQRFRDFILRRPAPKAQLQTFKVTGLVGSSINVRRPAPYRVPHKDRYL